MSQIQKQMATFGVEVSFWVLGVWELGSLLLELPPQLGEVQLLPVGLLGSQRWGVYPEQEQAGRPVGANARSNML